MLAFKIISFCLGIMSPYGHGHGFKFRSVIPGQFQNAHLTSNFTCNIASNFHACVTCYVCMFGIVWCVYEDFMTLLIIGNLILSEYISAVDFFL